LEFKKFEKKLLMGDSVKRFAQVKEYGTQLTASIQGRITIMGEGEQGSGFLLSKQHWKREAEQMCRRATEEK